MTMSERVRAARATAAAVCARAATVVALASVTLMLVTVPAWADDVTVNPSAAGMGDAGAKAQHILNMAGQGALWASLGSILAGAMVWGLSKHFGAYGAANKGMILTLGGIVGALLTGVAPSLVNFMFHA